MGGLVNTTVPGLTLSEQTMVILKKLMDSSEAQKKSRNELSDRLNKWEEKTKQVFAGNTEDDLDTVLLDTLEKFPQSIQPYMDMIEGQRMDLDKTRYKTFEELELYCYRVAGTVGLMTQGVIGIDAAIQFP